MKEEYTRDTLWGSYDGTKKPLKDLDNTHLLNLVGFLENRIKTLELYNESLSYLWSLRILTQIKSDKSILKVVLELIEERGLTITEDAKLAKIPFLDKKSGRYVTMDKNTIELTNMPKSIQYVKKLCESKK